MKQKHQGNQDGLARFPNRFSSYIIIALVVSAFLVLVFVAIRFFNTQNAAQILSRNQKQHKVYQNIIAEMHTGMRLARLRDFVNHAPDSKYTQAARHHISVLTAHEQSAWAQYSEIVYGLNTKAGSIEKAKAHYIYQWSRLNRIQQLSEETTVQSSKALHFKTTQSIYAKGDTVSTLIGGPVKAMVNPKSKTMRRSKPQDLRTIKTVIDVRVKSTLKPNYPRLAKRRGIGAVVVLSLDIDARGRVISTQLVSVKAKRYRGDFVRAAKRAARRSRFYPKTNKGKPVNRDDYIRTYRFNARR